MKTFHEWLRERLQREGLWMCNDKLALPGMSNINPLDQPKAKCEKFEPSGESVEANIFKNFPEPFLGNCRFFDRQQP